MLNSPPASEVQIITVVVVIGLRARAAAEAEQAIADSQNERELAQTVKDANRELWKVLGVGPLQWDHIPGPGAACSIRTDLDGFAIYFDNANRHLHWGGTTSTAENRYVTISSLAQWGRLISAS